MMIVAPPVLLEVANVAVSDGPLGTIAEVRLAASFQPRPGGVRFQIALAAWAAMVPDAKSKTGSSATANAG
jgi:hypothetical protein